MENHSLLSFLQSALPGRVCYPVALTNGYGDQEDILNFIEMAKRCQSLCDILKKTTADQEVALKSQAKRHATMVINDIAGGVPFGDSDALEAMMEAVASTVRVSVNTIVPGRYLSRSYRIHLDGYLAWAELQFPHFPSEYGGQTVSAKARLQLAENPQFVEAFGPATQIELVFERIGGMWEICAVWPADVQSDRLPYTRPDVAPTGAANYPS